MIVRRVSASSMNIFLCLACLMAASCNKIGKLKVPQTIPLSYAEIIDLYPIDISILSKGLVFKDRDREADQISGSLTIKKADDETKIIEYALYWGLSSSTRHSGPIVTIPVTGTDLSHVFANNTPVPSGATHLLVYSVTEDGEYNSPVGIDIDDIVLVTHDLMPSISGSNPNGFTLYKGKLYFQANIGGTYGVEPWVYDGINPPIMLFDVNSGIMSSQANNFYVYNNKLYFSADGGFGSGNELWVYDDTLPLGAGSNPRQVCDINPGSAGSYPMNFIVYNGLLYFSANDGSNGNELWCYNGAFPPSMGTDIFMVDDINGGSGSSDPLDNRIVYNSYLYFSAAEPAIGNEFWIYDGFSPVVDEIQSGTPGGSPEYLTLYNSKLYMSAVDPSFGRELFRYDGPSVFTRVSDINPSISSSYPSSLTVYNASLFFCANSGANGEELFVYDGVNAPSMVADINSGSSSASPVYLKVYNGKLYFCASDGSAGRELWQYDGVNPPSLVIDLQPGSTDAWPMYMTVFNNRMFFSATDPSYGNELIEFWIK